MNWTKKQKQVIDARDRSLLVSAAAGSGKTAVLVERIPGPAGAGHHRGSGDICCVYPHGGVSAHVQYVRRDLI